MKVVSITSKMPFKFSTPRALAMPEGLKLIVGLATACWLPTLFFCITIRDAKPLFLTFACEMLGTFWGLFMYTQTPYRTLSCVPASYTPPVDAQRVRPHDKRAA